MELDAQQVGPGRPTAARGRRPGDRGTTTPRSSTSIAGCARSSPSAVGTDKGDDRSAWKKWMVDLFGFAYAPQKSSSDETDRHRAGPAGLSAPGRSPVVQQASGRSSLPSLCFGAGTPVRTLDGLRPIEDLRAGDQVLTQNPRTGELKYRPIVAVYHNPPNATFRVELEAARRSSPPASTASGRPARAGRWPGTSSRAMSSARSAGRRAVKSIEAEQGPAGVQSPGGRRRELLRGPVGVLVHDNSTIRPAPEPFDAVGPLDAEAPAARPRSMLGR